MKKLNIIVILLIILISCETNKPEPVEYTPIFLYPVPTIYLEESNDIVDDYEKLADWKIKTDAYIDELWNQITSKVNYEIIKKKEDSE